MKKAELITAMAAKTGMKKSDTQKVLEAFIDVVSDELVAGEKVQITGFGTFEVKERAERQGRNPFNGESITIAASKHPVFTAGKGLKDSVK